MRGRVLAALAVTGSVSAAVGAPLLGWLAEHAGPRQTLVLAGSAAAVATTGGGASPWTGSAPARRPSRSSFRGPAIRYDEWRSGPPVLASAHRGGLRRRAR